MTPITRDRTGFLTISRIGQVEMSYLSCTTCNMLKLLRSAVRTWLLVWGICSPPKVWPYFLEVRQAFCHYLEWEEEYCNELSAELRVSLSENSAVSAKIPNEHFKKKQTKKQAVYPSTKYSIYVNLELCSTETMPLPWKEISKKYLHHQRLVSWFLNST